MFAPLVVCALEDGWRRTSQRSSRGIRTTATRGPIPPVVIPKRFRFVST